MSGDRIAMLIGVSASMLLVWRGWRSRGVPFEKGALYAAIWVLIIVVLTFAASRMGA